MKFSTPTVILVASLPSALAWGNMGHEAVAYIATNFVTSATKTYFQNILGDTTSDYLANVATYADTYRSTTAGKFSEPFHYIDAHDNPPKSCGVDYARDCGAGGCVVSAIANYVSCLEDGLQLLGFADMLWTSLVSSTKTAAATRLLAAKMIIHFIGDVHQPLHDENLDVGGNDISVTYAGATTNLHHIWDTSIPEQLIGPSTLANAKTWATTLTTAIKTGSYKSAAASWLSGINLADPVTTAMGWASDSNAYVCTTVLPNGVSAVETGDLSGAYYQSAVPTVQVQIAKAGYRLAAWLDLIATGSTGL